MHSQLVQLAVIIRALLLGDLLITPYGRELFEKAIQLASEQRSRVGCEKQEEPPLGRNLVLLVAQFQQVVPNSNRPTLLNHSEVFHLDCEGELLRHVIPRGRN